MARSRSRWLTSNMSHSLIGEPRPLAYAPRPFDAEVVGGWTGRIAAHYKMYVQAFAATWELDLRTPDGQGWLLMPELRHHTAERLAALTWISRDRIKDIRIAPPWVGPRTQFCYCARCVFLDPLDVAAPIWRREWLEQSLSACSIHRCEFQTLRAGRVLACRNLNKLLALVSRRERQLRDGTLPRRASRFHGAASAIR